MVGGWALDGARLGRWFAKRAAADAACRDARVQLDDGAGAGGHGDGELGGGGGGGGGGDNDNGAAEDDDADGGGGGDEDEEVRRVQLLCAPDWQRGAPAHARVLREQHQRPGRGCRQALPVLCLNTWALRRAPPPPPPLLLQVGIQKKRAMLRRLQVRWSGQRKRSPAAPARSVLAAPGHPGLACFAPARAVAGRHAPAGRRAHAVGRGRRHVSDPWVGS